MMNLNSFSTALFLWALIAALSDDVSSWLVVLFSSAALLLAFIEFVLGGKKD